jgi:hypothetical protein
MIAVAGAAVVAVILHTSLEGKRIATPALALEDQSGKVVTTRGTCVDASPSCVVVVVGVRIVGKLTTRS